MTFVQNIIDAVRNIRGEMGIPPSQEINVKMRASQEHKPESMERLKGYLHRLARVSSLTMVHDGARPKHSASAVVNGEEIFVPLEGIIDIELEQARLKKEIDRISGMLEGIRNKLQNKNFTGKAPPEIVQKEQEKLENFTKTREKLEKSYEALK
jgi:valyl-tRNA synthetase